jgi:hypothetical protein
MIYPVGAHSVSLQRMFIAVMGALTSFCVTIPSVRGGNLIVNGSFESPSAVPSGNIIEIFSGSEPAGFDWHVTSGTVEVVHQGYDSPAGQVFSGPAYQGSQWLDLDGISAGAISQAFASCMP